MGRRCPDPRPAAGRATALALAAMLGAVVPITPQMAGASGRWIAVKAALAVERHRGSHDARAGRRAGAGGRAGGRAPAAAGAAGGDAGLKADSGGAGAAGAAGALSDDGAYQSGGGAAGAASEARTGDGNQARGGAAGADRSDDGTSTTQSVDDRGGRTERAADPGGARARQPAAPTGIARPDGGGGGDASSLTQVGSDLSPEEEATLIEHGWK